MKTVARALLTMTIGLFGIQAHAGLIISEIVDGTLVGGLPKWVELTNTGDTAIDLSGYSLGRYNNGNTDLTINSKVLTGILGAGDSFVMSYENSDSPGIGTFFNVYGFDPDSFAEAASINGDDVIALFLADGSGTGGAATGDGSDATLVDLYGVIGVDGSLQAWDYTDGYSYRNSDVLSPNTLFTAPEWTFGGNNSLQSSPQDDALELALILANTTPGVHNFVSVPEPTTLSLLGAGLLAGWASRRRRNTVA